MNYGRKKGGAFDYLNYGLYSDQVADYIKNFDRVKVLLMEDLKKDDSWVSDAFDFLGVSNSEVNTSVQANPSGIPKNRALVGLIRQNKVLKQVGKVLPESVKLKAQQTRDKMMKKLLVKPELEDTTRKVLKNFYREDILKLSEIVSRDLSNWL